MKEIIVTSQAELDALPMYVDGRIIIKFGTLYNRAIVNRRFKFSVEARGNSRVEAREIPAWKPGKIPEWKHGKIPAW